MERSYTLANPYEVDDLDEDGNRMAWTTITDHAKWIAFEIYRENIQVSLDGEFDDYTDADLQSAAIEWAESEYGAYEED